MSPRDFLSWPRQLSIRVKLALASTVLLIIPLLGWQYVKELESFLRQDQQQRLLDEAKVVAKILASDPGFVFLFQRSNQVAEQEHIFVRPMKSPILLDGYQHDWEQYLERRESFQLPNLQEYQESGKDRLSFTRMSGHYGRNLYFFLQVRDKHLVYRSASFKNIEDCDHVVISTESNKFGRVKFVISTHSPGRIQAVRISDKDGETQRKLDNRIQAVWTETAQGYNVEIRLPETVLGGKFALAVVDVDDPQDRKRREIVSTRHQPTQTLTRLTVPSRSLHQVLETYAVSQARTWVINHKAQILAVSGSIYDEESDPFLERAEDASISPAELFYGFIRLLYQNILPQPGEVFHDDTAHASLLRGKEIDLGLSGQAASQWRLTGNERVNILRAVQPIVQGQEVLGAVVLEKNSNSILLLQNRAMEILMNTSVIVFLLSTLTLVAFASRLSYRIRRLRDDTESAISEDGRIQGQLTPTNSQDEIGDLHRSYAGMLERLADYNRYLEGMASKLSHELRTPITVVRSSLENLELDALDKSEQAYIQRAREGVDRLSHILTRMSEATRLEQTLKSEQKEPIDLQQIVSGCVTGYQIAQPKQGIQFDSDFDTAPEAAKIMGSAELIAQLLDKLVNNAMDFALKDTPVIVKLKRDQEFLVLSVENQGPPLPEAMQTHLFDSMVSVRDKSGSEPHLGLGLYIVRLIAEFHLGKPFARNLTHNATRTDLSEHKQPDTDGSQLVETNAQSDNLTSIEHDRKRGKNGSGEALETSEASATTSSVEVGIRLSPLNNHDIDTSAGH